MPNPFTVARRLAAMFRACLPGRRNSRSPDHQIASDQIRLACPYVGLAPDESQRPRVRFLVPYGSRYDAIHAALGWVRRELPTGGEVVDQGAALGPWRHPEDPGFVACEAKLSARCDSDLAVLDLTFRAAEDQGR